MSARRELVIEKNEEAHAPQGRKSWEKVNAMRCPQTEALTQSVGLVFGFM